MSDNMDDGDKEAPAGLVQYHSKLVGVTFEGRQEVIKVLKGNEPLRVRREPENQYDPKAVAVDVLFGEEWAPIGYIAKDKNQDIQEALDSGKEVYIAIGSITGGGDKSCGVNIKLEYVKATQEEQAKVKVAPAAEAVVERELTPKEKLQLAIDEFAASFTGGAVKKTFTSRLLGKSTEVTVTEGHISLPGYLSGSSFPKKFYPEFDAEGILKDITEKHFEEKDREKAKAALLAMWGLNRDASTGYGTAIHAALENFITYRKLGDKTKTVKVLKTKTNVGPNKALSKNPFLKKIVEDFWDKFGSDHTRLTEQFIWTHEEKLCGSIDLVKVIDAEKKIIRIQDFKTDGDINEAKYQIAESPFRGVGKKALKEGKKQKKNIVEDTLLGLHWLQLSFYAYILQTYYGYTVEGLDVYWLNPVKLCAGENAWEEFSHDVIDIKKGL